jgi:hypothetical protein
MRKLYKKTGELNLYLSVETLTTSSLSANRPEKYK